MDITVTKKKKPKVLIIAWALPLALVLVFAFRYAWDFSQAEFSIDGDTLTYGLVKQGDFTVSVRGTGLLVPDTIELITSSVEAKVERLEIRAGNIVKAGDVIVELSNPRLVQQLAEATWEYEAQEAEFKAAKVADELAHLERKARITEAKMNFESSRLRMVAEKKLRETGAVSKLDYERTVLENDQHKQRWMVGKQELVKLEENLEAQNIARGARLNKTRRGMERLQEEVNGLVVKATMNSVVLEMPLEVGQRITMGSNIAKLAQENSLIAELRVPEIQIREVTAGQKVIIDTRNNKVEGVVTRVDPSVLNGSVQVDVAFTGELPDDARPDLSVDGEIKIAEIENTFFVDRPLFSQSQSQTVFYSVSSDGQFAEQVKVSTGFGSINQIQILSGLRAGETIVTSDPGAFDSYAKFRIH